MQSNIPGAFQITGAQKVTLSRMGIILGQLTILSVGSLA